MYSTPLPIAALIFAAPPPIRAVRASSQASRAAGICVAVPRGNAPPVGVWKQE